MYQPALEPDQVKALYYLKLRLNKPMTKILRKALNEYLEQFGSLEAVIPSPNVSPRTERVSRCGKLTEEYRVDS